MVTAASAGAAVTAGAAAPGDLAAVAGAEEQPAIRHPHIYAAAADNIVFIVLSRRLGAP